MSILASLVPAANSAPLAYVFLAIAAKVQVDAGCALSPRLDLVGASPKLRLSLLQHTAGRSVVGWHACIRRADPAARYGHS
jgi:hypothetical protein